MGDPYVEGVKAALAGESNKANPYADGTANHTLWSAGWRDGSKRLAA